VWKWGKSGFLEGGRKAWKFIPDHHILPISCASLSSPILGSFHATNREPLSPEQEKSSDLRSTFETIGSSASQPLRAALCACTAGHTHLPVNLTEVRVTQSNNTGMGVQTNHQRRWRPKTQAFSCTSRSTTSNPHIEQHPCRRSRSGCTDAENRRRLSSADAGITTTLPLFLHKIHVPGRMGEDTISSGKVCNSRM